MGDPRVRWIFGIAATGLEIDESLLGHPVTEQVSTFLRSAPGPGSSLFFYTEKEEVEVEEQYEEEYEEAATELAPSESLPEAGTPGDSQSTPEIPDSAALQASAHRDAAAAADDPTPVTVEGASPGAVASTSVTLKKRIATRKVRAVRDRCRACLGVLPDVTTKVVYFVKNESEASGSSSGGGGSGTGRGTLEALTAGIEFGVLAGDCLSDLSGLIKEIYAPWLDYQLGLGSTARVGDAAENGAPGSETTTAGEHGASAALIERVAPPALAHEGSSTAGAGADTAAGRRGAVDAAHGGEFRVQLQRFDHQVAHALQQVHGDVRLNVPALDMDDADIVNDFEAVQQLETAMEEWTRLVAGAVEAENGKRAVGRGPLAEAEFWRRRHASLSALHEQIGLPRVQRMLRVLEEVEAPMLPTFQYHLGELSKLYAEAKDNVKFLATLERHFKNLATGSMATVLDTLPSMMHAIRMVWTISRHYNTDERLVPLMEMIAAELAARVEARVDVKTVLQRPPEAARLLVTEARKVLETWLSTYMATRHKIEDSGTDHRWEFDRKRLFEQTNYMARVCGDLLEVATVLEQFRNFLGPELKSVTGESAGIDRIVASVDALVKPLERVPFDVFDRKYKDSWHAVMQNLRLQVESIESMTKSFIEQSFQKLRSAEGAFELVQNFKNIQSRDSINQQINERYRDILIQYTKELDHVAALFAAQRANPPVYKNYPPVAGAIAWARDLYLRAKRPILRFKAHDGLLTSPFGDEVKQRYLTFARAVDAYVAEMYSGWEQQAGITAVEKLKQPILCSKAAAEAAVAEAAAAASTAAATAVAALSGRTTLSVGSGDPNGLVAPSATVLSALPGDHRSAGLEDPAKDFAKQQALGKGSKAGKSGAGNAAAAGNGDGSTVPGAAATSGGNNTASRAGNAVKIPPPPYAINFAPELQLMIRESKHLDRMGFSIPEGALNVTLQEDKYHSYCRELELMLRTYDHLSASMTPVEARLLKRQIAGLNATLRTGFTPLNWNSQRIPAFLEACNRALHEFQGIFSQIHKSAAMIGEVVSSIESMVLVRERDFEYNEGAGAANGSGGTHKTGNAGHEGVCGKPLPPMDVSEFYDLLETKRISRLDGLARKYSSIESLLIKVEEVVAGTNTGAAPALAGYYHYWEKRVLNAVTRMVLASMATFLSLLQSRDRPPLCKVHATLNGKDLVVTPAVNEVYKFLTRSVKGLVESAKAFRRWMHGTCREAPAQGAGDEEEPFVFTFYMDLSQNPHVIKLMLTLNQAVHKAFQMTNKYLDGWRRYDTVYNLWNPKRKQALDKLAEKDLSCVYFDTRIASYEQLAETVRQQPSERDIEFLRVDCSAVAAGISAQANQWCQDYGAVLHQCSAAHLERLTAAMAQLDAELDAEPQDLESLKAVLASISRVSAQRMDTELVFLDISERYRTLVQYKIECPHEEVVRASTLAARWEALYVKARTKDLRLVKVKDKFREVTRQQAKDFVANLKTLEREFRTTGPGSSSLDLDQGARALAVYQDRIRVCVARKAELVNAESLFGLEATEYAELVRLTAELRRLERVYALYAEHKAFEEANSGTSWADLDVAGLQAGTEDLERRARQERELREHPVFRAVEARIHDFKGAIPLIVSLKNEAMKHRHWVRLGQATGVTIDFKDPQVFKSLTLGNVFAMELHRFETAVGEIVNEAVQEQKIEVEIRKIEATWRRAELPLQRYIKNGVDRCYVLRAAEEVKVQLEDNMLNLQTIAGSRFVGSFVEQVRGWEKTLNLVNETLDVWYAVQRKWMYLESIFVGAEDIRQQLPEEAKRFDAIDKAFKQVMAQTYQSPNVVEACTVDNRLQALQGLSERLDTTQKSLSDYLDTKRNAFPRFFFISDDELLSVLGSSDPTSIQVHLLKLFDNAKLLTFNRGGKSVTAMTSSEGESFAFRRPVAIEGAVECWMTDVESEMAASLRQITKAGVYMYAKEERTNWLKQVLGMVSLVGSQVWWTWEVEDAFRRVAAGSKSAMKELEAKLTRQLNQLVALVREELDDPTRKKVNTLLIIDVHARDIVDGFVRESVLNAKEFAWESQLRFYWDRAADDCRVKQCTGCFSYGYEYMGLNGRLVITPLTDRCYMTLTQALTFKLGGAPAGPAGTGKTETTKDLAKSLALPCFVINCGEGLDYKAMASIFAGLIQVGAWGCFDEFNRINIEVLSVVSAQLKALQNALVAGMERVDIGVGGEIRIRTASGFATVGVFITMNPGYAGRTELPDNLKALFRPVTMVVPDLLQICEIMLFSEGFEAAKTLAKKMTVLYKLSREQLSRQYHYDFGLRALKSVLVMAGGLKRRYASMPEDLVLMRALRDSNMPKFVFEDVPLFAGLVNDLFPGMDCPRVGYEELKAAAARELEAKGCRCADERVFEGQADKCVQLYETQLVRHTTMIVGPTGGGKTTVLDVLRAARLAAEGVTVRQYVINPKKQPISELYGVMDPVTRDWTDGVLSKLFRELNEPLPAGRESEVRWLIYDGDVDAVWVENMNSVMDDNRILTLPNGERIRLQPHCAMICETSDLQYASPATISRCGMVWVDPKNLGYRPFYERWVRQRCGDGVVVPPERQSEAAMLMELFEKYVPACTNYVLLGLVGGQQVPKLRQIIPVTDLGMVRQLCSSLDAFLGAPAPVTAGGGANTNVAAAATGAGAGALGLGSAGGGVALSAAAGPAAAGAPLDRTDVEATYIFCLVWSLGAALVHESRDRFDDLLRKISGEALPNETLYSHYYDRETHRWEKWATQVPAYAPPEPFCFHRIAVPTTDSVLLTHLLRSLAPKRPLLLVGESGTAKTATVGQYLSQLHPEAFGRLTINFSSRTTSQDVQRIVESAVDKRAGAVYGPSGGRRLVVFVDDLNMPKVDEYGTQQPIALLLYLVSRGALYDRGKDLSLKHIRDLSFIAAMGPPGGGRNGTDPRFVSLFNAYNVVPPSTAVLHHIYSSILTAHLASFPQAIVEAGAKVAEATLKVFGALVEKLPPTPSKFHYIFNLRDLSRIFEGLCLATEDRISDSGSLARLWRNECLRVLGDRLTCAADSAVLAAEIASAAKAAWPAAADAALAEPLLFGDFEHVVKRLRGEGEDPQLYGDLGSHDATRRIFEEVLENYNMDKKPMNLVLFESALEHLTRLHRVLRMPRGNALLVGVGGSGKRSLARLAAYCASCGLYEMSLVRNYGENEFREDLRSLYRLVAAGPVVFLFTDAHVVEEGFLEAINNMLTTGMVPGLFERDEAEQLAATVRADAKAAGLPDTPDARWGYFVDRCRDNLHIVLAMSPSGDKLRIRCRNFPGLISGCVVDWFQPWPSEALHKVAEYFLQDEPLPEQLRTAVVGHLVKTHETVVTASARFAEVMRRHYYVTPANYLDFISNYRSELKENGRRNHASSKRLEGGLTKLVEAAGAVDVMREELTEKKAVVDEKTRNVETLIGEIQTKSAIAGQQQADASVKQQQVQEQAEVIAKEKASADDALMEALPAVEAAAAALENLDKKDLDEIKAFNSPPQLVKDVCMQVCILRPGGDKYEETWGDAKKMLGNSKLLDLLKNYPKDSITGKMMGGVKRYFKNPSLTVENMKSVSKAGTGLLTWVVAISKYYDVAKNVEPLRNKVRDMERAQQQSTAELEELMQLLSKLNAEIAELNSNYSLAKDELTELQLQASIMEKRLTAASKLITGLTGERSRWTVDVGDLLRQRERLVGDCLLSASFLSYLGAFTAEFRADLLHGSFVPDLLERGVAVTQPFRLEALLTTDATVQQWVARGLPSDAHSVQNGILTTKASRFPLCVDPQQQAVAWIKNTYAKDGLCVKSLSEPDFMKHLELAIQFGKPFLFEGIDEEIDPMLDPVLDKNIIQDGPSKTIKLGDKTIDWDDNFRLLFTTKLANPHYSPEVMGKTMIINYGVTMEGLADQLLNEVVAHERPDLEESYAALVTEMSESTQLIVTLEDTLLKELGSSQGNILDNEELIRTLDDTKSKAEDIKSKLERARFTRDEIAETRAVYKPVAKRGSVLYFAEAGLVAVLSMYEISLDSFLGVFRRALAAAKRDAVLDTRIANMVSSVTRGAYDHTCTGIFERHKLMFSFQMTCMIMDGDGRLDRRELDFFLKGDTSLGSPDRSPPASWITPQGWKDVLYLASMHAAGSDDDGEGKQPQPSGSQASEEGGSAATASGGGGLRSLLAHLELSPAEWRSWYDLEAPEGAPLPGGLSEVLTPLQSLCVVRCLRPDRAYNAVKVMVAKEMGEKYVQPPVLDFARIFAQSGSTMPMVFILSPGANPQADIAALGAELGFSGNRLKFLALGQGQGPLAEQMMEQGYQKGHWVLLQNCHLLASWLRRLEKWLERNKTPHKDFRLWLTTEPTDKFPMGVLQRSLKVVTEPPDGLKQNMRATYAKMDNAVLEECAHPAFRSCLYVLAFLHAVLLERRKYGKIGWNVKYDFNESDFSISRRLVALYLSKAYQDGDEVLPWGSLKYLVGDAMYGGRVSDDMDRRVLSTYLAEYMGDFLFDDCQRFYFSRAGHDYRVPDASSVTEFVAAVEALPLNNSPAVFGLHANAEIGYYTEAARDMWHDLIALQPRKAGGGSGHSREARIGAIAADVRAQVPLLSPDVGSYDLLAVRRKLLERNDGAPPTPCQVVLLQELERWNALVIRMAASLKDLERALAGEIGMSDELDALGEALFNGFLPAAWRRLCPSTQKPLGSWMRHFARRRAQYDAWIETGEPAVMWLAGLHAPESYLTALVQTTCRANNWPLDKSTLYTVVTKLSAEGANPPEALSSGCYLSGLYLEGAGWDEERQCLRRQDPKALVVELPLLQVIPVEANKLKLHGTFRAPVYVTQERRNAMGVGLVFEADLCTSEHPSHWVLQGVALTLNVA